MSDLWVDIDNPPQAQYLSPIAQALREQGHSVLVTVRDHAPTLEILANRGVDATPIGGSFGASSAAKALGTIGRAARLCIEVRRRIGRPAAVVSTARSGVLAAWALRAPAFSILDYEGVELGVFRRSGTVLLHPSVVPAERFTERGFPVERLQPFPGLKEDLAFSGLDVESVEPVKLPAPRNPSLAAVLVRPPSQTSHYRADESVRVLELVLNRLAARDDVQVVFVPREVAQTEMLTACAWMVPPVVLERTLPLVGLLGAVDWVVTGGGTMLREAAWLGVPGVTVFQGAMPAVDEWLEGKGAIRRVRNGADADAIDWSRTQRRPGLVRHPEALGHITRVVLRGSSAHISPSVKSS